MSERGKSCGLGVTSFEFHVAEWRMLDEGGGAGAGSGRERPFATLRVTNAAERVEAKGEARKGEIATVAPMLR